MALATYTDLQASAAAWLNRSDLTAAIPDFIALAEARIARDLRLRKQIASATLVTVAGTQGVTLPTDLLEVENMTLSADYDRSLQVVTPEYLDVRYPTRNDTGIPTVYALLGDQILFGTIPDSAYTVSLKYYARLAALSVTPTNWLLTYNPGVYLWATLSEASAFLMADDRAALWEGKYQADCSALRRAEDDALRSGSAMRVRAL